MLKKRNEILRNPQFNNQRTLTQGLWKPVLKKIIYMLECNMDYIFCRYDYNKFSRRHFDEFELNILIVWCINLILLEMDIKCISDQKTMNFICRLFALLSEGSDSRLYSIIARKKHCDSNESSTSLVSCENSDMFTRFIRYHISKNDPSIREKTVETRYILILQIIRTAIHYFKTGKNTTFNKLLNSPCKMDSDNMHVFYIFLFRGGFLTVPFWLSTIYQEYRDFKRFKFESQLYDCSDHVSFDTRQIQYERKSFVQQQTFIRIINGQVFRIKPSIKNTCIWHQNYFLEPITSAACNCKVCKKCGLVVATTGGPVEIVCEKCQFT